MHYLWRFVPQSSNLKLMSIKSCFHHFAILIFFIHVKSSLVCTVALLCLLSLCINNVTMILYCYLSHDTNNVPTSVVESFERVASTYAQQLSLNETQNFTTASLTLVTELVSKNLTKHNQDYYISNYYVTQLTCRII